VGVTTLVPLTDDEFVRFSKIVFNHAGIHLPEEKKTLLANRLRRRLRALGLKAFSEYEALLLDPKSCEKELPFFLSAVTTNETYFFRNPNLWTLFQNELIPQFVKNREGKSKTLCIRSAASSSGEEAYTLAFCLREKLPDFANWNVTIIGTDISRRVLEQAEAGVYDEYAVQKMSALQVKRWFKKQGEDYQLCDDIKNMVQFKFHDLRKPYLGLKFDFVLLRNVLMYFDTPTKQEVITAVTDGIVPQGYLFVGDVDPIRTTAELNDSMVCEFVKPGLYRKPERATAGAIAAGKAQA
jgi:chemotaxis protein methyltransferase CheR